MMTSENNLVPETDSSEGEKPEVSGDAQSEVAESDSAEVDSAKVDSEDAESEVAAESSEEVASAAKESKDSDDEPEVPAESELDDDFDDEFDGDFVDEDEDENEDAAPLETLVEETVEADGLEMDWYILKVQVNRETSICDALRRRVGVAGLEHFFSDVLVPTEDVREFAKSGKQRIVKRKLYPGYVVVRMAINDESWFLVRETPGIGDFTGAAGKPAPLTKDEIDRILHTTLPSETPKSDEAVKIGIKYKVGDRVRVKEGNFQNYEGDVSNIDERNGRVTVMINIFNRPNPVELDHWQVEEFE